MHRFKSTQLNKYSQFEHLYNHHIPQDIAWNFLKKLKMELPFDLAIPLLGLYPKNPETPVQKKLCTPMFTAVQFTRGKCWKQPMCPSINEWIKKLWCITQWSSMQQKEGRSSYPL